jgi:regulator of cell morphogenesis and NO signaling
MFDQHTKIASIVVNDFRSAEILRKYGIDFCCGGNRSIGEACDENNVSLTELQQEIDYVLMQPLGSSNNFNDWDIGFLGDYILNTHHRYIKSELPVLRAYLEKIAEVHGDNHPELHEVKDLFIGSSAVILKHLEREEIVLFPYIKELTAYRDHPDVIEKPYIDPNENPLNDMVEEHQIEGERFRRMSELTINYAVPEDACNTYLVAMKRLENFEKDLHRHIHLENNILFPKTLALESKILV